MMNSMTTTTATTERHDALGRRLTREKRYDAKLIALRLGEEDVELIDSLVNVLTAKTGNPKTTTSDVLREAVRRMAAEELRRPPTIG